MNLLKVALRLTKTGRRAQRTHRLIQLIKPRKAKSGFTKRGK